MMKNYYTPKKEDLFIGYECEVSEDGENWESKILTGYRIAEIEEGELEARTQCLTKEQIEQEGWKLKDKDIPNSDEHIFRENSSFIFTKKIEDTPMIWALRYERSFNLKVQLRIDGEGGQEIIQVYSGKCTSINEFRKICNLIPVVDC